MDLFGDPRLPAASKAVTLVDFGVVAGAKILAVGYVNGWDLFQVEGSVRHIAARPELASVLALRPFFHDKALTVAVCLSEASATVKIETASGALIHVLRASRAVSKIWASEKYIGLAGEDQLQLFSIAPNFPQIFSMQTGGAIVAVGPRWVAFSLPPQQVISEPPRLSIWDTAQRALDNFLLRAGEDTPTPPGELRPGIVGVREAAGGAAVGSFEAHAEPLEFLKWDVSGIFLISASGRGHQVLVHRASAGLRGKCGFSLAWTLSRGVTPATISDSALLGGRAVVASARGTVHFYALGSEVAEARVKFGAPLASEGLLPLVVLGAGGQATIATRTGKVESFVIDDGEVVSRDQAMTNFIRGAGDEFPSVGEFAPPGNTTTELRTSGDFIIGEGSVPIAWHSPQISVVRGSYKGKHVMGMMLEYGSKTRLESQRARTVVDGIKINLGNSLVLEASLSTKMTRMMAFGDKRAAPGSESPDGFIAI